MTTIFELAARLQTANAAEALLLLLLKATLILAIARLLLAALPRVSAATKHMVATAALVAVGLMPLVTYVAPTWEIAVQPRASRVETNATGNANDRAARGRERTIGVRDDEGSTLSTAVAVVKAVAPEQPLTALERASTVATATWKGLIVLILGFAALLLLVHMAIGMIGVWYVARNAEELTQDGAMQALTEAREQLGLDVQIRLLRSSRISVPVLWGLRKPVLLLPPDVVTWPSERLRVVLLHELAHLKRYDGISLILTRIAVSLFWFHPLAWSLERAGRSECERACDDLVLAGGTKPSEYADHLLAIARSMPTFDPFRSVTLAMSRKSQLEGRLLSILQPHVARQVFSGSRVAVACALAIAAIIPLSAMRLTAEPSGAKQQQQQLAEAAPKVEKKEVVQAKTSGSEIDVTPHVESLEDYFLAKFGKHGDRFARTPKDGDDWYDRAYDYYHADRYEEAAAAFRRAAKEGSRPATSLYNAACSYALMGDANRAIPALQEALAAGWDDVDKIADDSDFDPIRSDPRFARVVKNSTGAVVNRRLNDTMENYQQLRAGDADPDDWHSVGLDLLRLRKIDEAIEAFQKSIEHGSKASTAMYNIACAYSLGGDVTKGMDMLSKSIDNGFSDEDKLENDPDIALLRKQPGFPALLRKAKDFELRGVNWSGIDVVSRLFNDWDDSVAHHRRITQKYPDSGRAWFNLGYAALQAREFDTAIEAYNRTLALGYSVGTSSYNMACAYARKGDRDAAFTWLERARAAKFDLGRYLDGDEDLDSLHRDPRWDRLTASVDMHHRPFWKP